MDTTDSVNTKRIPFERSAAYPAINLKDAIDAMEQLRKNLGVSGKYSRESAAQGLGYLGVSGASARKVAALVHYGLLIREGNTYRQSLLATRIALALTDDEKLGAIRESAKCPKLFNNLIEQLEGQALPAMLPNLLSRDYSINEKVSKDVAEVFRQSIEFAGLLNNGIVSTDADSGSTRSVDDQFNIRQRQTGTLDGPAPPSQVDRSLVASIDYPLPSGVVISFPMAYGRQLALGKFADALQEFEIKVEEIIKSASVEDGDD